jgi:2-oxo-hept-3-ene-1,7-dioate hydratase
VSVNHKVAALAGSIGRTPAHGNRLEADQNIMCGSFARPLFGKAGAVFNADYGSLGSFSAVFG